MADKDIRMMQEQGEGFDEEEQIHNAEVLDMDVKIQQFRDRVAGGDQEALAQIADLMK